MLSADELADLQTDFEAIALDKDADIQRNQSTTFSIGQPTENWQSILPPATTVKCGMTQPSAAQAALYASQIGALQASVISFALGQDVKREDLVIVQSQTWTVQAILTPPSYPVLTQVLATRIA